MYCRTQVAARDRAKQVDGVSDNAADRCGVRWLTSYRRSDTP